LDIAVELLRGCRLQLLRTGRGRKKQATQNGKSHGHASGLIIAPDGSVSNRDFQARIRWIPKAMLRSLKTGIGLSNA
jgi:hypothetical protein